MPLPVCGISEAQGWRESMEDAHEAGGYLDGRVFAAAVYDGHGGALAARTAARILTPFFLHLWLSETGKPAPQRRPDSELVRLAYLAADEFISAHCRGSGAAAATFYLLGDRFLAANAGDARIVIGTADGAQALSLDHKPHLPQEKARIEALGGRVVFADVPRVQGVLAMSRALGDAYLKPWITAEPRVVEGVLGRENDCLILACDGVWDVVEPEEAVAIARSSPDPREAADRLVEEALSRLSTDNLTAIVLDLRPVTASLARDKMEILSVLDRAAPG